MHISKKISVSICVYLWLVFLCPATPAQTLAPGAPGNDARWATAGKQAIGTSATLESKVWFTLAQGALTEVYYPDVTVANVHKLEFVVVNPKTKKVETETADAIHEIKVLRPDSLSFQQINTAKSGEWKITKTYTADPERDSILIDVKFEPKSLDLNLYVYYDPSLGNTGMHDTAWSQGKALLSQEKDISSALIANDEMSEISSGFYGVSDGLEQLKTAGKITTTYQRAENGNVAQIAKLETVRNLRKSISFALGFGKTPEEALQTAKNSLGKGFAEYEKGWSDYVKTLPKVEAKYQAQFNMAAMVLKAQEDKTVRGANVASLTIPWGGGANANEDVGGGYHLVWSRDLYQVVTAYMALGDMAAANRALDFLFNIQQKEDGSFPQNSWLDGKKGWGSLQLDEVAYPLILAYQLKRFDKPTYENHVKRAAAFLVKTGPKTTQERWEEKSGYSPSTIAAEIAGLVCAADIAKRNGDDAGAEIYLKTADDWQANIEKWTATTNGKYGDGNYYVRLTENGKPDAGEKTVLNNGAGTFQENEIVDAGFLELVRLGIKSPDDPLIQKSVKVVDEALRVKTPNGESFYRYNHDGYGEMDDGRRWNFDGKYTGKGRLWALLAGERGQYELAMQNYYLDQVNTKISKPNRDDTKKYPPAKPSIDYLISAKKRLEAMANFANDGLMIPEQVWDKADVPKNIDKQFVPELKFGEGTGSATPLAWSMAQFIRLAVNLQAGRNLDTPDIVYERYVLSKKSESGNRTQKGSNDDPGDIDIAEIPVNSEIDKRCFFDKPLYKKDCSYTSTMAKENLQNPQIVKCRLDGFYLGCKDSANEMHACFNYKEEFKTLEIAGDFTGWKPSALKNQKQKDGNLIDCFNFAKTGRVEYKLIVDGKWILDPLNPNKVDNGVGGENSFFTMPEYQPTSWDKKIDGLPTTIETLEVDSKIYGKRAVQVYVPFIKSDGPKEFPVLYLQDGTDYINRAKAVEIQQNLVAAGKVQPFIMVFIDYKDRMKEYWASDDYAKFLATEVVPAIDAKYKTVKSPDGRGVLGASLGGITSVHTAIKYPEIFGRVGGQSSSFWIDNERVVKELNALDAAKNKFRFYFDVGTLEGAETNRRAVEILRKKGFNVAYEERETGHNWTSWRDRLADAFIALWADANG